MVRHATASDSARVGRIHVDGWRAAYRGIMPDRVLDDLSEEKRAAGWKYFVERDPHALFVFERDNAVLGWAAIGGSTDGIRDAGEIFALYVDPAFWRQGCGLKLMDAAEEELWSRGYATIALWVLERNHPARAFYESLGYIDDGGRKTERFADRELVEIRMGKQRSHPAKSP